MGLFDGFFIPLIEITFIFGFVGWAGFYVVKGFHNAWTKEWKYVWKYKVRKKAYPETTLNWVFSCIDAGIGWYGAKKLMMVGMTPTPMMNETLFIYDKLIIELNKEKGGIKKHGRQFERGYSKEVGEFPTISNSITNTISETKS